MSSMQKGQYTFQRKSTDKFDFNNITVMSPGIAIGHMILALQKDTLQYSTMD